MKTLTLTLIALVAAPHDGDKKKKGQPASQPQVAIEIQTDALVRGTHIFIRDVATVQTADPQLTERILGLDLGRPPQPGYTRTITRNDILLRIMRENFPGSRVKFIGATRTFLQPVTHHLTATELTNKATELLDQAILESEQPDITYKPRGKVASHKIPAGRESRVLKARLHRGELGLNHVQVDVDVHIDGELYKTFPVRFALTRYYRVLVAAYALRPGTPLNETNVEWKRIEARFGAARYITSLDQVRGHVARRLMRRGEILMLNHMEPLAVIRSGDVVELLIGSGPVRVRARVRALDSGHLGKSIRVQRLTSVTRGRRVAARSILFAKVVSPNLVVISPTGDTGWVPASHTPTRPQPGRPPSETSNRPAR